MSLPKKTKQPAVTACGGKKIKVKPEKIVEGLVVCDSRNAKWLIGSAIGSGGFADIYAACRYGDNTFAYAMKWELYKGNGSQELFFYTSVAQVEDIERYKRKQKLKSLGVPHMIASGKMDYNGIKHQFLIMPRYGIDVTKQFIANGGCLPVASVYRLTVQMLDVYEYVHSKGYVHADLKGANIVLGCNDQAYLVDYGLATPFNKSDASKKHHGTVEFTSRDAHQGLATRRGDLEVLAWNLIKWLGGRLPWVYDKLLSSPSRVATSKRKFMKKCSENLKLVFDGAVPHALFDYFEYVKSMNPNDRPDYQLCRQFFYNALGALQMPIYGKLVLTMQGPRAGKPIAQPIKWPQVDEKDEKEEEQQTL